ncbi:MAG TPA: hypothetical protein VM513_30710 [Kofleriaceae bacterium]|nr:hypothetical protein [Kofleriaceae bacterium]
MRLWLVACLACACSSSSGSKEPPKSTEPAPKVVEPAPAPPADDRYDAGALGALSFQLTEGTPAARTHFTRGLLALHSFWYDEATREFEAAIAADPKMNMAYWGAAMSQIKVLWGEDDVGVAAKYLGKMPNPDALSPREQAWILALIGILKAPDVRSSRRTFVQALTQLHTQFPDDESATFLALALLSTTRPEDPDTLDVRRRAAELANTVYARNPKHPGAAHYMIHAFDTPQLAPQALAMAQAYATIAPAAFHARHMPAHIFSRLGMWQEAIASCRAAWDASVAAATREKLSANHHDFHSLSWLVEMPFELGRRSEADAALTTYADAVRAGLGHQHRMQYATEVASYLRRTGEWARVDELLQPLASPAVEEQALPGARTAPSATCTQPVAASAGELAEKVAVLEARALAASMQRDAAGTKRLVGELDTVRKQLRGALASMMPADVLAKQDAVHTRARAVLLARAGGNDRALLAALRTAATDASAETGGESNPSGFVAHEEIGELLARMGDHKAAAAAFKLALTDHPGRARSLLGAARTQVAIKDLIGAKASYEKLLAQWSNADASIDGLAEAKTAVAP